MINRIGFHLECDNISVGLAWRSDIGSIFLPSSINNVIMTPSEVYCSLQNHSNNTKPCLFCPSPSLSLSLSLSFSAVYPDDHPYDLYEPECISSTGDALHAQSLCHYFPPRAECPEAQAQLQGGGDSCNHVLSPLSQAQ